MLFLQCTAHRNWKLNAKIRITNNNWRPILKPQIQRNCGAGLTKIKPVYVARNMPLKCRVSFIRQRNADQPVRSLSRSLSSDSNSLSSRRSADCNCCWCAREAARCAWNSSRAWSIASSGAPCSRAALRVASGWLEPSGLCTKRLRLRASSSQASSFQYSANLRTMDRV